MAEKQMSWSEDLARIVPVKISCNRCKGKLSMRAFLVTPYTPIFEEGVRILDSHEVRIPMQDSFSMEYNYTVPCGACAGTGCLSTIPDEEVFRRKRKARGVVRMEYPGS